MRVRVLAVAVLLLLAGCNTGSQSMTTVGTSTGSDKTTTISTSSTSTTIAEARQNPWREETVTIAVDTTPYSNRSYLEAVRRAATFWNEHVSASPYTFSLEVVPNASNPDIRVDYKTRISECGDESAADTFWWCTDTYGANEVASGTSQMLIAGGYTATSTTRFVKQAFADLLGVDSTASVSGLVDVESPRLRDPWAKPGPVVVAINQTVTPRNMTPLVRQSLRYWETTGAQYANYTTEFVLKPEAVAEADVVVEFTQEVDTCGVETGDFLGCAPLRNKSTRVTDQKTIHIETGYTNASTLVILKHEFGHLHGRQHGQEPMPIMNETYFPTRLPMPNATERPNPWMDDSLLVYVEYASFEGDQDQVREQVRHALEYYSNGADGYAPENLTLKLTRNASKADIRIRAADTGEGDGSLGQTLGMDLDSDRALEYYTNQTITIDGLPTEVIGWHVGYWLATTITNEHDPAVFPPPFRDASYEDRRDWWQET